MKILYIATVSGTINAFLLPHIEMLIKLGHQVDVACKITRPINNRLLELGCKIYELEFSRSPLNKGNFNAYKKLKNIISKGKYNLVHTHTPIASAITRLACRSIGDVKVFYTAHGFHFFKGSPIINWIIYYPIEFILSKYTDVLITINKEDYIRANKFFNANKIEYIPGVGLNTEKFSEFTVDRNVKRKEIGIPAKAFALLSVGELNKNKNHEVVIKAIAKLNNPHLYYVICGKGKLMGYLEDLSKKLGINDQVKLLGSRTDISEICKSMDAFVFPSFREGLSVALMEAMASGLPIICSNIRGNNDLIENKKGGYLVKPNDVEEFANKINEIYLSPDIRNKMSEHNIETIKCFDIAYVLIKIQEVYLRNI